MMLRRRDLLLAAPLMAGAAAAFALTPRERLDLLNGASMEKLVPMKIADWSVIPSNALILPKATEGSLADQLYSQTVSRLYTSPTDLPVMLVIAYGSTQSDQLQLHRPEACYAAVGFEIGQSRRAELPMGGSAVLPVRQLVATTSDRIEPILYWTRIGDYLPVDGREQRMMKLRSEFAGFIADGVLVRMSTVGDPTPETFASLQRFAVSMVQAVDPRARQALVGRPLAAAMKAGS